MAASTGGRFAQLRQLFDEVCDLPAHERRAHLERSGADTDVVAEVEALAAAQTRDLKRVVAPVAAILAQLPETELDVGDRIGAWRLVEKLASGGMGAVYRAERADGHFEQQAAIKLLRGIPTEDALALLASERQILAGLQHPHIARLLDGGATPGGQPYLVMEYVEGVPIDRWCREQGLRLKARLRLFRNVCRAVAFAHQRLIVHCDLKPSNVLVRADGSPVLLDFGIARVLDRSRERASEAYYTPGYASPEQLAGAPLSVASDIYSLGLILFELVSGRKARLDADDATVTQLADAERRPSELAAAECVWRGELRGDLDAMILRATARHPGLRYAAADALARDIERHLDRQPVSARAPTWRYRFGRLVWRRWPLFAAGVVVTLMAAGFSWRLVNERDRALAAERQARSQAETAEQVSQFLVSIFEYANPEKNPARRDISAREMLEESTQRLQHGLADKPEVKARLIGVLARAWDRLGQPRRAIALYRDAVAQWQQAGVRYERERARVLADLAVVQTNSGHRLEAVQTAQQALALREAQQPRDETELADSWNTLGLALRELGGRDAEAQDYLERALAVRRREGSGDTLAVMHNLAGLYANQDRLAEAAALYEETLAAKRARYGGDAHPSVVFSLNGYAETLVRQKRYDEGVQLYRQAIAVQQRLAGAEDDNVASGYNELGSALQDAGRYAEAMQAYREALRIRRADRNVLPAQLGIPLNNLAVALDEMGDYAAAEPLYRESLAIRRQGVAADDPLVLRAEHNLARLLLRAGRADEAQPLLEHALAGRRARLSPTHADIGRSLLLRVEFLRRSGQLAEAVAALAELDAAPVQANKLLRGQRERERAQLALARGEPAAAAAALRAALELYAAYCGEAHPLTAAVGLELAAVLREHEPEEARRLLATHAELVERNFAATSAERRALLALRAALDPA